MEVGIIYYKNQDALSKNLHFAHGSYSSKTTQDSISRQASPDTGL